MFFMKRKERAKMFTLRIYLKGGSVITLPNIKNWEFTGRADGVTSIRIVEGDKTSVERIVMPTLNLDEVACVTQTVEA